MKKGLIGVASLAVAVLASYYGTGMLIESNLRRDIKLVNQTPNMKIDLHNYKRGMFSSSGDLSIKLHLPEQKVIAGGGSKISQDFTHTAPITIYHGPFIFTKGSPIFGFGFTRTTVALPEKISSQMKQSVEIVDKQPVMDIALFLNYLFNSEIKVGVPAFELKSKNASNPGTFSWLGLKSNFSVSSGRSVVAGDTVIDGMRFSSPMVKAIIGKLATRYDVKLNEDGLWLGKGDFSFPSMKVEQNGNTKLELSEFKGDSKAAVVDGLFEQVTQFSLNQLMLNGEKYGPGNLNLAVRKLDAKILAEINRKVNEMNSSTTQERQMMMFSLLPKVAELVEKGAELEISNMYLVMPQGKVEANAKVLVPKGKVKNPMLLVGKVKANAEIRVPIALVKQTLHNIFAQNAKRKKMMQQVLAEQMNHAQGAGNSTEMNQTPAVKQLTPEQLNAQVDAQVNQQLGKLVQMGLLVVDADYYRVKIEFQNSTLTVNGKQFNPTMLK